MCPKSAFTQELTIEPHCYYTVSKTTTHRGKCKQKQNTITFKSLDQYSVPNGRQNVYQVLKVRHFTVS